jgi:hypothetical protein
MPSKRRLEEVESESGQYLGCRCSGNSIIQFEGLNEQQQQQRYVNI